MPFGKYKGLRMGDVPAAYLLWLYDNRRWGGYRDLRIYIEDNLNRLLKEVQRIAANNQLIEDMANEDDSP